MPAKLIQLDNNYLSFSSVYRGNNMIELHNSPNPIRLVSNHNFVDLLYVFDNRAAAQINLNDANNRLSIQDILDDERIDSIEQRDKSTRSKNGKLSNLKRSSSNLTSSTKERLIDKNDLMSNLTLPQIDDVNRVFSPALMYGNAYKPTYGLHESFLYSGSRFVGFQQSTNSNNKSACNAVEVTLQHVDLDNFFICGHLKINGLTEKYPLLSIYFDGEIISEKYPFLTRKYDADYDIDRQHWSRFGKPFIPFLNSLNEDNYDYSKIKNSPFIFMRWCEKYLTTDPKVKKIDGASFAGFYYILFSKVNGSIEGFYYHKDVEWYQLLNLKHDPESASQNKKIYEVR